MGAYYSVTDDYLGAVLDVFLKGLNEDMVNELPSLAYAKKTKKKRQGINFLGTIGTSGNPSGTIVTTDGGAIPTRGKRQQTQATFHGFKHYVGIGITDEMLEYAEQKQAAVFDLVEEQFTNALWTLEKMDSCTFRRPGDGVVAQYTAAATPATTGNDFITSRFLVEEKTYDVVSTGGVVRGQVTIEKVDADGTVDFKAAPPAGTVATDFLVYPGMYDLDAYGFPSVADDGTEHAVFGGLTVANLGRYWMGYRDVPATARALDAVTITKGLRSMKKASGKPVDVIFVNPDLAGEFAESFFADLRLTRADMGKKIGPGYSSMFIQVGPSPVMVIEDDDMPVDSIYAMADGGLEYAEWFPAKFRGATPDSSKKTLHRSSTNFEYEAEIVRKFQLCTWNRKRLGIMGNFSVTDSYKA